MTTKYSKTQIQQAVTLRKEGKTIPYISELTGIKKPSLKKIFQEKNIKLNKEQYRKNTVGARWKNYKPESTNGFKTCSVCNIRKEVSNFGSCANSKDGLLYSCKGCQKKYYQQNKQKILKRVREYRDENRAVVRERNRRYYRKNKEKVLQKITEWREENREKCLQYGRKWASKNQWRKNHNTSLRRNREKLATPKWLSEAQKQEILDIYKKCPNKYHIDHIIPINSELVCGLHVPWNLQYLPESENMSKGNDFVSFVGVCYQKKQRDRYLKEDIEKGFPLGLEVNAFDFQSEKFTQEHREFIERYEWLGTIGFNVRYVYTARWKGNLAGVLLLSEPNAYMRGIEKEKQCLIQRGACASWASKNLNSKLIMSCLRWMVQNTKKRMFVGYSDLEAGEIGTIYQACNFDYLGCKYGAKKIYTLLNGKKVSSRHFTKTSSMKKWAKELNIEWQKNWDKANGYQNKDAIPRDIYLKLREYAGQRMLECRVDKARPKGKYLLLLGKTKKETKKLRKNKKYEVFLYPKRR